MNTDETVMSENNLPELLRIIAYPSMYRKDLEAAADLIESLQAQLAKKQSDLDRANGKIQGTLEGTEILERQLTESQRRERAAVEDLKLIVDAVREEHCDETCCFACKYDADMSITGSGAYANECPGFERNDCFEWRGPQEAGKGEAK